MQHQQGDHHKSQEEHQPPLQSESFFLKTAEYNFYVQWKVPKLFQLVVGKQWDQVPQRAKKYPNEAKFVHAYDPKDTALHRILRRHDADSEREDTSEMVLVSSDR